VETLKKALLVVDYMYDFGANDGKLKWWARSSIIRSISYLRLEALSSFNWYLDIHKSNCIQLKPLEIGDSARMKIKRSHP